MRELAEFGWGKSGMWVADPTGEGGGSGGGRKLWWLGKAEEGFACAIRLAIALLAASVAAWVVVVVVPVGEVDGTGGRTCWGSFKKKLMERAAVLWRQ